MSGEVAAQGSLSVRTATMDDKELIESLRASVGWSTAETGLTSVANGRSVMFVLAMEGSPAASAALVMDAEDHDLADGARTALISNLIVRPDFQRHGLGTHLLHFLEAEAERRKVNKVTIGVDASNTAARRLYEREGYRVLKHKVEVWGAVDYLAKSLTTGGV